MANEVVINVNADVARAKAGLAGIADKMKAVGRGATVAGGLITGLGVASVTQFAKMGDEVQKMALRTGFSTEALSELRVAAELSGSSLKGMETGIRRMSKVIVDAGDGLAESKDALDRMGVSVDDLMGKSPEVQFEILSMALAGMTDKTAQAATAQEVFGRAGTALLPMLAGGAAGLEEMKQKAHEMGVVFDQEAADKAARLSDSFTTLKGSLQGVMLAIADQLAPVITDVAEKMGTAISKISAWTDANPGLTQVIVLVTAAIGGLLLVLGPLMMVLPGIVAIAPAVGAAFTIMMGPVGLIVLAIAALVAGVIGLAVAWNKNLGGIREKTAAVFGFIKGLYESKLGWILPGGALIKALIMLKDNWGAIWGGMKDFVAAIWNKILEATSAAINFIITNLNKLIDGFNTVFQTSIPPIEEMAATLQEVGSAVRDDINAFIRLGVTVSHVLTVAEAEAERFKGKVKETDDVLANIGNSTIPNILMPQIDKLGRLGTVVDDAMSPFLEYGKRLEELGRPMEDLLGQAQELSDEFGISLSDAIDNIARVRMRELDQEFNLFMENLLAKKEEAGRGGGGGEGGGGGGGGGEGGGGGMWGTGAMWGTGVWSIGLEAAMTGKNPTIEAQLWLDGRQIDTNQANQGAQNEDTNSGGI